MKSTKDFFNEKAIFWDSRDNIPSNDKLNDLLKRLEIGKNDKILDLGCGTGIITNLIYSYSNNDVLGLDISDKMIEIANKKNNNSHVIFEAEDFYKYNKEKFDCIICHNAYCHFIDKIAFKNKCYELLNDDGILIICHSYSREKLLKMHKNHSETERVNVKPVKEEVLTFLDKFDVIKLEDDEFYIIKLKKHTK